MDGEGDASVRFKEDFSEGERATTPAMAGLTSEVMPSRCDTGPNSTFSRAQTAGTETCWVPSLFGDVWRLKDPGSNNELTALEHPGSTASEDGDRLYIPHELGLTSPRSRRICTTLSCPATAAYDSGVLPYLSDESELTSSRSKSIFTTPSCPAPAA